MIPENCQLTGLNRSGASSIDYGGALCHTPTLSSRSLELRIPRPSDPLSTYAANSLPRCRHIRATASRGVGWVCTIVSGPRSRPSGVLLLRRPLQKGPGRIRTCKVLTDTSHKARHVYQFRHGTRDTGRNRTAIAAPHSSDGRVEHSAAAFPLSYRVR